MATNQHAEDILKPILDKYVAAIDNQQWDDVIGYYNENAVLVNKGVSAIFGAKAITESLRQYALEYGQSKTAFVNSTYQSTQNDDHIVLNCDFEAVCEKSGNVNGKIYQVWKKENGKYQVLHDQFEILDGKL